MILDNDPQLHVRRFRQIEELAPLAAQWNHLAGGIPFRSWDWLETWWRHYGGPRAPARRGLELYTLGVFNGAGALVGLAPWYLDRSKSQGRVVRFLGSGEVCSDYMGVLSAAGLERLVPERLSDWLAGEATRQWDLIELEGVDYEDAAVGHLVDRLAARGHIVHRRSRVSCWRLELPPAWDEYLAAVSKSHRERVRKLERRIFQTGRAVSRSVEREDELGPAFQMLVDLHQRRWRSLGEPGCFASPRFTAFHAEVARRFFHSDRLRLHWIELDGRPVVVTYDLCGPDTVYFYQCGIDPDVADERPGWLGTIQALKSAVEHGYRAYDFLRGDEAYKAAWGAEPRPLVEIRVVGRRASARLRHGVWLAGTSAKRWLRRGLEAAQSRHARPAHRLAAPAREAARP